MASVAVKQGKAVHANLVNVLSYQLAKDLQASVPSRSSEVRLNLACSGPTHMQMVVEPIRRRRMAGSNSESEQSTTPSGLLNQHWSPDLVVLFVAWATPTRLGSPAQVSASLATMEAERGAQQPNFGTISGSFDALSEQFALCANLPAVDGSARLMQRMDAVLEQLTLLNRKVDGLDRKVDGLDRKVDGLDRRVDGLDRKITVSNRNAVMRAQNSMVVRGDMDLVPLYSVLTGEVIDGFPQNLDQLERLHARDVDQLLRHLGESVVGSAAEKKRNLKLASGLITRSL
ncbi:Uncharacterized protein TPAR_07003 [Tolypocladium paradoxum]|uniref:Uncharacterized protein n=1 Tax=Tolypocladium paradoxum TaxID=94208 RepID=A0A2S4KRI1_9HYPO|nr:Uncharacterized protein TPAR_07003 [Tolypocladium paradoxum]